MELRGMKRGATLASGIQGIPFYRSGNRQAIGAPPEKLGRKSGGSSTFTPTFIQILSATPTGVNDTNGNPVQWTYNAQEASRGAQVLGAVGGLSWSESNKKLSKTDAFADYEHQNGDTAVIADSDNIEAGEYTITSKLDDSTIKISESITTNNGDTTGVSLTEIRRYSGHESWGRADDSLQIVAYNHYEDGNDGSGRQLNGIDHDGSDYPAGFKMQPIQNGLVVRADIFTIGGTPEAWFSEPNAEDGTCT